MGHVESKSATVRDCVQNSQLTQQDINEIHSEMKKQCPSGSISLEKFKEMYKKKYPKGDSTQFTEQMFRILDKNKNGTIEIKEFLAVLYLAMPWEAEERLKFVFNVFDVDKDGKISRQELLGAATAAYQMKGELKDEAGKGITPEALVDSLFMKLDRNADDLISLEEFTQYCKEHEGFLLFLGQDFLG